MGLAAVCPNHESISFTVKKRSGVGSQLDWDINQPECIICYEGRGKEPNIKHGSSRLSPLLPSSFNLSALLSIKKDFIGHVLPPISILGNYAAVAWNESVPRATT